MGNDKEPVVAYVADWIANHVSIGMPRHPPRLSVALLWAKPGEFPGWRTDLDKDIIAGNEKNPKEDKRVGLDETGRFDPEIERLLHHVYQRLEKGLDEPWYSRFGYDILRQVKQEEQASGAKITEERGRQIAEDMLARYGFANEPEERWARTVSEMFVFAPYAGIGTMLLGSWKDDHVIYEMWPHVYSTVVACQHLSTFAALARGYNPLEFGNGLTAGPNGLVKAISAPENNPEPKRAGWFKNAIADYQSYDLRPGDIASGKQHEEDQNGFAHCATVLRRWPFGSTEKDDRNTGAVAKLQWIDTGVLAGVGDSSTMDHDWIKAGELSSGFTKAPFKGLGRFPTPRYLRQAVEKAQQALPMGFVRLVLVQGKDEVRYASAMLPMWFGTQRFSMARYIWSLRDLPLKDKSIKVYWLFYAAMGGHVFEELLKEAGVDPVKAKKAVETALAEATKKAKAAKAAKAEQGAPAAQDAPAAPADELPPGPSGPATEAPGKRTCEAILRAALSAQAVKGVAQPAQPPGLRLVAACSNEPKVLRDVTVTGGDAWSNVAPADGLKPEQYDSSDDPPTKLGGFYSFPDEVKAYKKKLADEKDPVKKAALERNPPTPKAFPIMAKISLVLRLDTVKANEDAWRYLQSIGTLSQELVWDSASAKLTPKPMGNRAVRYFNGTEADTASKA
jgi:hypothetical protein